MLIKRFHAITLLCMVSFLLSFVSSTLSVLTGVGLACVLIMQGRPENVLGLFLLYYSRYTFIIDPAQRAIYRENIFTIAGFPVTAPIAICAFVASRVIFEQLIRPGTFRKKVPPSLLFFWLLAFFPVMIGTWMGYQAGNANWTRGMRFLMIAGSYFYGHILAKNWGNASNAQFISMLAPLAGIVLSLMNLQLFNSHHFFFFLGFGTVLAVNFIQKGTPWHVLLGTVLLGLSARYAVLYGTFTMLFIVVSGIFYAYTGMRRIAMISRTGKIILGSVGIASIFLFTLGLTVWSGHFEQYLVSEYDEQPGMTARMQQKAEGDRRPLWEAAVEQIKGGPYFIVPSGRPLYLDDPRFPTIWVVGAHNTVLEVLRLNGFFAGTIMLAIYIIALRNNLSVLYRSTDVALKCLAATVLSVATIGMMTGDFPADQDVGFFLWSFAGIAHGLFLREHALSPLQQQRTFPGLSGKQRKKGHGY